MDNKKLTIDEILERMRFEELVALGQAPCPQCNRISPPGCLVCSPLRTYWRYWKQVAPRFKDAAVHLLKPQEDLADLFNMDRQRDAIALVKVNPSGSYYLAGMFGAGKTHFLHALYRQALYATAAQHEHLSTMPVWLCSAPELVEAASARKSDPSLAFPRITPELVEKVSRQSMRPCLFLDELDKFSPTESRMSFLGSLIDSVYSANGQIVAAANMAPIDLVEKWDRAVPYYADSIIRRFAFAPSGTTITFTPEPKEVQ
ncbi:ATP-binding protein [Edaphobacter sp. HDX4]|uniref:ATP-binding protein n=1 Tax=Edaphobacter sp. HDX4 TaxID=2794064 RepID=UPI002FE5B01F